MPETKRLPVQKPARTAVTIYAKRLGILLGIAGGELLLLLVVLLADESGKSVGAMLIVPILAISVFLCVVISKRAPRLFGRGALRSG